MVADSEQSVRQSLTFGWRRLRQLVMTGVTKSREEAEAATGALRPGFALDSLGDLAP